MADKKSQESRRKLLKSIAAGSGAIVAGKSLPENWKRPVVDSVILPAHAQTSPPTSPPTCTLPQTIPPQTANCATPATANFYTIRSANSPCEFEVTFIGSGTPPSSPYVRIDLEAGGGFTGIGITSFALNDVVKGTRDVFLECSNPTNNGSTSFPLTAFDETGKAFQLNGQWIVDVNGPSVSMSELTITP